MGCLKAKDKFSGKLVKSTRVHFKKGKEMVKGLISSQMEGNGRGSGRTINKKHDFLLLLHNLFCFCRMT